jgi:hypothetical protein
MEIPDSLIFVKSRREPMWFGPMPEFYGDYPAYRLVGGSSANPAFLCE